MNPYLAQGLAAIVPMIVGFLWYNPKTFEPAWMESIGMTKEKMEGGNMAVTLGVSLLMAFIFANKALFEQRSFKYFLINFGYWAVTLGLMGGILDAALPTVGT